MLQETIHLSKIQNRVQKIRENLLVTQIGSIQGQESKDQVSHSQLISNENEVNESIECSKKVNKKQDEPNKSLLLEIDFSQFERKIKKPMEQKENLEYIFFEEAQQSKANLVVEQQQTSASPKDITNQQNNLRPAEKFTFLKSKLEVKKQEVIGQQETVKEKEESQTKQEINVEQNVPDLSIVSELLTSWEPKLGNNNITQKQPSLIIQEKKIIKNKLIIEDCFEKILQLKQQLSEGANNKNIIIEENIATQEFNSLQQNEELQNLKIEAEIAIKEITPLKIVKEVDQLDSLKSKFEIQEDIKFLEQSGSLNPTQEIEKEIKLLEQPETLKLKLEIQKEVKFLEQPKPIFEVVKEVKFLEQPESLKTRGTKQETIEQEIKFQIQEKENILCEGEGSKLITPLDNILNIKPVEITKIKHEALSLRKKESLQMSPKIANSLLRKKLQKVNSKSIDANLKPLGENKNSKSQLLNESSRLQFSKLEQTQMNITQSSFQSSQMEFQSFRFDDHFEKSLLDVQSNCCLKAIKEEYQSERSRNTLKLKSVRGRSNQRVSKKRSLNRQEELILRKFFFKVDLKTKLQKIEAMFELKSNLKRRINYTTINRTMTEQNNTFQRMVNSNVNMVNLRNSSVTRSQTCFSVSGFGGAPVSKQCLYSPIQQIGQMVYQPPQQLLIRRR